MQSERNLFDVLRLLAASLVFYSHSYALAHLPEPWFLGTTSFGGLGVAIFFGISGYLVTTSFNRDQNPLRFLAKRALRIFPALIVVCVLCAYALGPLLTSMDVGTYFSHPGPRLYVYDNVLLSPRFDLPGVFANNPFPTAVNGSLWTLPLEFFMYLVVAAFSIVPFEKAHRWIALGLVLLAVVLCHLIPPGKYIAYGSDFYQVLTNAPYFFVGSYLSYHSDWVKQNGPRCILPFCIVLLALVGTPLMRIGAWIIIPCVAIFIGERKSSVGSLTVPLGDVSYGVYLWSFPLQQTAISYLLARTGLFPAMLVAAVAVLIVAKLSWTYIERPALNLKRILSRNPSQAS